ncbi:hypothetical protein N0V90_002825 [Kalmusia sp. IMI 367209]|nr:hypothetical protein N0V90_002825 [Kalmusia sp. IMI 367209]
MNFVYPLMNLNHGRVEEAVFGSTDNHKGKIEEAHKILTGRPIGHPERNNELRQPRYYEAAPLLYSTRTVCLDSPTLLVHLHRTLPITVFDKIGSMEIVFCSAYAAPIAELNIQTVATFQSILKQMSNLRLLHIMLPYLCWRDFFYETNPTRRLIASQQWERVTTFYGRDFNPYVWDDVVSYLDWLKELGDKTEVVVTAYEDVHYKDGPTNQLGINLRSLNRIDGPKRTRRRLEGDNFV